jgi:hypothetical protein
MSDGRASPELLAELWRALLEEMLEELKASKKPPVDLMQVARKFLRDNGTTAPDEADHRKIPLDLPDHLAASLGQLQPDKEGLRVWDLKGMTLLSGSFRKPETDAEWVSALSDNAKVIPKYFANSHRTGFSRIAAAIEWYEDSLISDDQSMAFIAACIGLESIFGEEATGMTELSRRLVDRYSFMLGKDRDERSELARDFEEVLKVRGQLVHARTSRLKAKDRVQLDKVREMLLRSIQHEVRPFLA